MARHARNCDECPRHQFATASSAPATANEPDEKLVTSLVDLALQNLLSPLVLFFALGLLASLARSDLAVPEAVARGLALYLMLAIGFKGGVQVANSGLAGRMFLAIGAGVVLSLLIPVIAFALLRATTKLSPIDAAAAAAHYGSISIVTFVAATQVVQAAGLSYEGYLIAVAAVMEAPAIFSALLLARMRADSPGEPFGRLLREIAVNSSIVMLVGAFAIGWITGARGLEAIRAFIVDPFYGVLCLFLLDMGLIAGRGMREGARFVSFPIVAFGLYMPLISASLAALLALAAGLSAGGAALFITLAASASYIAVPAAMRIALPEANPAVYLMLSLGVSFPFNLALGIPLYLALARWLVGS